MEIELNEISKTIKDEPGSQISYYKIFRFATPCELSLTIVGVICGFIGGSGFSVNLTIFGEVITSMVERSVDNGQMSRHLPVLQFFGGGRRLQNATHDERMAALMEDGVATVLATLAVVGICMALCVISVAMVNWSALRQITRIRTLFLRSVMQQDMAWFDTDEELNLASIMSEDMVKLKDGFGEKLAVTANLTGTFVSSLIQPLPLGWELTLACAAIVPLCLACTYAINKYQTKSSIRELEAYNAAGKHAEEVLRSIRTVVAFGGEEKEMERYKNYVVPAERYGRKRGIISGLGSGFNWILLFLLDMIAMMYGTRLFVENMYKPEDEKRYSPGDIIAILFTVHVGVQTFALSVPHMEVFSAAKGAAAGIFKLIDQKPIIDVQNGSGRVFDRAVGEIMLKNVGFSYPSRPGVKVLNKFTLRMKAGESVAFVGPSGSGKSTILQLVQRFYDPQFGSVFFDGNDFRNLNLKWLRSKLGVVGQEPVLFRGSIKDNIAIGCPEATLEEIHDAAKDARAHEFIQKLPNGYDTLVGEQASTLSGGQKQRIAIARVLLRNPSVLVLDEPTSALDPKSERLVQAALDRASEGRTTIIVSHRLPSIVNVKRIIYLDNGIIVEDGTHNELMDAKGAYYNLVTTNRDKSIGTTSEQYHSKPKVNDTECDLRRISSSRLSNRKMNREYLNHIRNEQLAPRMSLRLPGRASISSMSSGYSTQSYYQNVDPKDQNDDEIVKPISDLQLLKLNGPEWPYLVVGALSACLHGACYPAVALLIGYSFGIYALPDEEEIIYLGDWYGFMFLVVSVVSGVSMCLQTIAFTTSGLKMTTRLRCQYFCGLLKQEIGYFDKESNTVGVMCARLSGDTAEVQGATGQRIGMVLQGICSMTIGFIVALFYNWSLTLVGCAFLPLLVFSIWIESRASKRATEDEHTAVEEATSIATEAIVSIKTVRSLGIENIFMDKFIEAIKESNVLLSKSLRWRGLIMGLSMYIPGITWCLSIVYGANLIVNEGLEYNYVILVNEAIMYGMWVLGQSFLFAPNFNSARACGARILALINREPEIKNDPDLIDNENWSATGNFSLKDVKFSYPSRPHEQILKGINLKVEAGKTVALVGSSGCGKSTVLQLIQRFYDPVGGKIKLDNRDTRSLTLHRLRLQLGVVQQQPVLFDRTFAENIAYGVNDREVTMDEIMNAAEAANIHSFIVSLPKGYDTNVGSSGAQISGGQKQRVCIARALIRSPRLLLLDEATSALDVSSERIVTEALQRAAHGRSCIIIAHNISTIKDADTICVLDKGQIMEKGTHAQLLHQKGLYYHLAKDQNLV